MRRCENSPQAWVTSHCLPGTDLDPLPGPCPQVCASLRRATWSRPSHDRPHQDLRPEEGSAEASLRFCHWPGGDSPGEGTVLEAQMGDPSSPRVQGHSSCSYLYNHLKGEHASEHVVKVPQHLQDTEHGDHQATYSPQTQALPKPTPRPTHSTFRTEAFLEL